MVTKMLILFTYLGQQLNLLATYKPKQQWKPGADPDIRKGDHNEVEAV